MEKKLRYSLLDALRGVAIIAMIIYHLFIFKRVFLCYVVIL